MQSQLNDYPKLFLIRHGATDWSESRQHTGLTDLPLNEKGEQSANRLKARLSLEVFGKVYTSPLLRAKRTCELAGLLSAAEICPELVEWDYGDYEGLTTKTIQHETPGWNVFAHGAPNGESPEQVANRADRFIQRVRAEPCNVVAFSSGHILRMIAARWLGISPESANHLFLSTASFSVLGYEHGLTEPSILLWNEIRES